MNKIYRLSDNVFQLKTRRVNMFFVRNNEKILLVDSGIPCSLKSIEQGLEQIGYTTDDITAFVGTHAHYDHVGSTHELLQKNKNIKVYMSSIDAKIVDHNFKNTPELKPVKGYEKLIDAMIANPLPEKENPIHPFHIDEYLDENSKIKGFENISFIFFPGHTYGQLGLTIDDGDKNILLGADAFRNSRGLDPMFIYANVKLGLESILKIKDLNVNIIGVGHGRPVLENTEVEIERVCTKAKKLLNELGE